MFGLLWLDSVRAEFRLIPRGLGFAWPQHDGMVSCLKLMFCKNISVQQDGTTGQL